ncbi:MAG: Asp-tRNA(Asn)/Glu-tRNA(Gln) amidotransferase subunit GatA [Candidatus Moranbacteria bacterium]|nr:Asp-tRNA(Asn)/Glu-tRNA(Gln) amidotransferase subunit GatA [Candidatus Moranbacteria bacterium]
MSSGYTISQLHDNLQQGKTSAPKVTEEYFRKIKKEDWNHKIYLTLNEKVAVEQAAALDKKIRRGEKISLMEGIPVAVKDVLCTKGLRTTAGSKILENYTPAYDATAVKKLREEGSVILGKVNCDEFAMGGSGENSAYGVCPNPLDPQRVPGGSSSGSAAAVAKDLCVFSLGTDTGGSVRLPASFCGIVGLKPTYGRISRYGLIAMASSLDQVGILAKNVNDSALTLSAIAAPDRYDGTSSGSAGKDFTRDFNKGIRGLTLAYDKDLIAQSEAEVAEKSLIFLEKWKDAGGKIQEVQIPFIGKESVACYYIITASEISSNMARYDSSRFGVTTRKAKKGAYRWHDYIALCRGELLGKEVKRRILLGTFCLSSGYYDAYYGKAQQVRYCVRKSLADIFKKYPLIFTPTSPTLPFKIGERVSDPVKMYLADVFTTTANLAGVPAISFPIGNAKISGKKLSIGGQLMAAAWDEETLLRAAYWGEKL